jgi:NADPH-dependent 2,4-dienoyl-CoA reductase/sulfur reductase-like enzyme
VDPELGALFHAELEHHGVVVLTSTTVTAIARTDTGALTVTATTVHDETISRTVDLVLVVVGVGPDAELAAAAGAELGVNGAIVVDETMRPNLPDVFAAGDCAHTHHRLLGLTRLPLGTTAHKQGRVAGENTLVGDARFAGSLGAQVVKVFDLVAARTGREHEAPAANRGWTRVAPLPAPMTTRPTTRAPRPSTSASPATTPPDNCLGPNSSDTAPPKSPNASTPTPPPCFMQ